ncbi:Major facilitator superfamily domain-containing protein 12 [Eumeta japonica]|uniref:Major facilitator superfamily domain-containing protein 12 n=1 Tax=Eumeta variegata TaxID=151549 RepID=A0A4C1XEM6_EUMVA|nr:Major facilitator superfamily domain-containing protein 12 [Eumeta japonica]
MVFQIGWAAVQISHLSLIPELAEDEQTRTHLTAVRFGFTVFSNLFVYIITWIVLHITGECDKEQVGPADAWKFRHIVYILLALGAVASVIFHIVVKEKQSYIRQENLDDIIGEVAVNAFQEVIKDIPKENGQTAFSIVLKNANPEIFIMPKENPARPDGAARDDVKVAEEKEELREKERLKYLKKKEKGTRKLVENMTPREHRDAKKKWKVHCTKYRSFGGAIMLVTSLALTADLVGARTEASAFVYGLMSFTDKLSCGIVIAVIQMYADTAENSYYREVLSWVCGGATIAGLVLTLFLPNLGHSAQSRNDDNITTDGASSDEPEA